ncbi:MAG: tape measure protein [Kordiimonadaceae bacterium]|nr:tape measure protein [Kordiimonadaceae bacterium]
MAKQKLELALKMKADLDQARRDLDKLTNDIDDVGDATDKTDKKFKTLSSTMKGVATVTAAVFATRAILRSADEYGALQNRLRLVTETNEELAAVTQIVFDISQKTSSSIDSTATIYQRFAQNGKTLNITQAETARLTEIVAKSIAITGGTAQSADAALVQFGQALSSGVLRGDEFRSISEQAQGLRDALAKGLGVEIGELKKMADAGRLTSDVMVKALLAADDFVDEKFDTRVKLMSQALVELDNSVLFLVGDTVTGTGVTNDLADSISGLAGVLQEPGTKAAFTTLIELLAGLATGGIELAAELGDLGVSLDTIVQSITGTLDPLEALERQIYDVQKAQRGWLAGGVGFLFTSQDELKQLEAQLKAERDLLLAAQKKKDAGKGAGDAEADEGGDDPIIPPAINKQYQQLLVNLKKQATLLGETSEAVKVRYAIEQKLLGKLDADQQALLLKYAEQLDARRASVEQAKAEKRAAESLAKSQKNYVNDLERQVAVLSLSTDQVRAYELAEKGLTGALLQRAQAATAAIDADERKQQADADASTISGIRAQLLRGQGNEFDALAIELSQQSAEISQRLQAVGDEEGVALINRLINVEQAGARMAELQAEIDRLFSDQARTEQSIDTQLQAGTISEINARQQIVDLHAATAAEVEKLLPLMQELAAVTGDPAALERVKDLQAELGRMRVVVDETAQAIQRGFEDGLSNALEGLATRTLTIREAVQGMARDIARSLAQLAAQKIANSVTTSIFGGGDKQDEGLVKGAAAVSASSLALGTASASLVPGALAIEVAATSLLAAAVAAQAVGSGGDSASGFLSAAAGFFGGSGGVAAATGGQVRGPGTGTSDSIAASLSHEEFVTRAAVVTQPGALAFLYDFNRYGMAALNQYALRVGHNTGGLAGVPDPVFPAPSMPSDSGQLAQPAAALAPDVSVNQRFMLVDDPDRIADGMRGSQGEDVIFLHLSRNPGKLSQIVNGA